MQKGVHEERILKYIKFIHLQIGQHKTYTPLPLYFSGDLVLSLTT